MPTHINWFSFYFHKTKHPFIANMLCFFQIYERFTFLESSHQISLPTECGQFSMSTWKVHLPVKCLQRKKSTKDYSLWFSCNRAKVQHVNCREMGLFYLSLRTEFRHPKVRPPLCLLLYHVYCIEPSCVQWYISAEVREWNVKGREGEAGWETWAEWGGDALWPGERPFLHHNCR